MRRYTLPFFQSALSTPVGRRPRRAAALVAGTAVLLTALTPLAPAQAVSPELTYTCTADGDGTVFKLTVDTDAPATAFVSADPIAVKQSMTFVMDKWQYPSGKYWGGGAKNRVTGGIDYPLVVDGVANASYVTINAANKNYAGSGKYSVLGSGNAAVKFTTPGDIPITATDFTGTFNWVASSGIDPRVDTDAIVCEVYAGQNTTVDTVRVVSRSRTDLVVDTESVQQGTGATATATVSVDGGVVAGYVRFTVGSQFVDRPVSSTGVVTATLPVVAPGVHSVTAEFVPTNAVHYRGSNAGPEQFTVVAATPTSTSLLVPATSLTTETITAKATVATDPATSSVPRGRVEFLVDGAVIGDSAVNASGLAQLPLSNLTAGGRTVLARFVPTSANDFEASESAPRSVTVTEPAVSTGTALQVAPDTGTTRDRVKLDATVTAASGNPVGEVEFFVHNADYSVEQTYRVAVVGGAATQTLPLLPAGTYGVQASFWPTNTALFEPSSSLDRSFTLSVPPVVGTSAALTLSKAIAEPGDAVTATVVVAPASGTVPPSGQVEVTVGPGNRTVSGALVNGQVVLTLPALTAVGSYTVDAVFTPSDPSSFGPSSSPTRSLEVKEPPAVQTTTLLRLSDATITTREQTTATAEVVPSNAAGRIIFSVGDETHEVRVNGGEASFDIADLSAGTYQVAARFVPDLPARFTDSTAPARSLEVRVPPASPTTTSLSLSRTTASTNDAVSATATVAGDFGTPAGTVTFTVNGSSVTGTLLNRSTTVTLPSLPAGTHSVTAQFTPTNAGEFLASSSARSLTVTQAPVRSTVTTVQLSNTRVSVGSGVDAVIDVASGSGTPHGQVEVTIDGHTHTAQLTSGTVTVPLAPITTAGTYPVTARFLPSDPDDWSTSTSAPVSLTVTPAAGPAASTVGLSLARTSVRAGDSVAASAQVASSGAAVTGQVDFVLTPQSGPTRTVRGAVDGGRATVSLESLTVGTWSVEARFLPSGTSVAGSISAPQTLTVSSAIAAVSATSLELDRVTSSRGEAVQATASVATSGTVPTGMVLFTVDGRQVTAPVSGVTATATLPAVEPGTHQVSAQFVPSDPTRHVGSTATQITLSVHDSSAVSLLLSTTRATVGETVSATAQVTTTGLPATGVLTFFAGGQEVSAPVVGGQASVSFTGLGQGSYPVTARFASTRPTDLTGSTSAPVTVTVVSGVPAVTPSVATSVALALSIPTAAYGRSVSATATVSPAVDGVITLTAGGKTQDVTVVGGTASAPLPRLEPGSHPVVATFTPRDSAGFAPSSATTTLSITKDTVKLKFGKRWSLPDNRLTGKALVRTKHKVVPTGRIRILIKKKTGKKYAKVYARTMPLDCAGVAAFTTRLKRPAGTYRVTVRYLGSTTHQSATVNKTFRIG